MGGAIVHWGRNLFNRGNDLDSPKEADDAGYDQRPPEESKFHTQGAGNEGNTVWTSGGNEAVFTEGGNPVRDDLNGGTFNYCPYKQGDHWIRKALHGVCDVAPYMILGNSPRDALRLGSRIKTAVGGAKP